MNDVYIVECPYCKHELELNSEWAMQHDKIYCGNCTQTSYLERCNVVDNDDIYEEF
jgi:transcription elongation factor Elf1